MYRSGDSGGKEGNITLSIKHTSNVAAGCSRRFLEDYQTDFIGTNFTNTMRFNSIGISKSEFYEVRKALRSSICVVAL